MATPKIGDEGHVSFLVLEPKFDHVEKVEVRDAAGNILYKNGDPQQGPVLVDRDVMTAETFPTDETRCHFARITGISTADDGTVTVQATGSNAIGESRRWVGVVPGPKPRARLEDPAGHVFHALAACPWER